MIDGAITKDYCPVHSHTPCACYEEPTYEPLLVERVMNRLQAEAYAAGLYKDLIRFFDLNEAMWAVMRAQR